MAFVCFSFLKCSRCLLPTQASMSPFCENTVHKQPGKCLVLFMKLKIAYREGCLAHKEETPVGLYRRPMPRTIWLP